MNDKNLFYENLKSHRQSKGIDIQEICDATKIAEKYILAIENGTFDILPNVYMRLFIISYCKFIGLDHKKTIHEYEIYTQTESQNINTSIKNTELEQSDSIDDNAANSELPTYLDSSSYFLNPVNILKTLFSILILYILYLFAAQAIDTNSPETPQKIHQEIKKINPVKSQHKEPDSKKQNTALASSEKKVNLSSKKQKKTIPNKQAFDGAKLISRNTFSNEDLNVFNQNNSNPLYITVLPKEDSYMYIGIDNKKPLQIELLKGQKQILEFDSLIQFDMMGSSIEKIFLNLHDISNSINNHQDLIRGSYNILSQKLFISLYK